MNKWVKSFSAFAIAGTLLAGTAVLTNTLGPAQPAKAAESDALRNVVNVTGAGELSVKPDIVTLTIGVETEADTAKAAQSANSEKMAKITAVLKDTWKVDAKDIQTGQFYVQPNYSYTEKEGQKVKGYTAHHSLNVTYRDLTKVGQLLDAVSEAGANRISDVRFSTENTDQFQEQVIDKAMNNAKLKASAIAKSAGRSLGMVVNVTLSGGGETPVYMQNEMLMSKATADSAASTSLEAGEVTLKANVTVTYELK